MKEKVKEEVQTQPISQSAPVRALDKYTGKYILKPCKKSWISQLNPKHDGAVLFSETAIYCAPELDKSTGLVRTGLTDEEARELETILGLQKMTLSPYNKAYWADFRIYPKVTQEGVTLDLDTSAMAKLQYLFCRAHTKVAKSYAEALENPEAELVLTSQEKEAKSESSKIKVKTDAFKKLAEMTITEQIEFLKVHEQGKYKVSKSSTPDFINATIGKIVDDNPESFLETLSNPYFKTASFLQDCITAGLIKKTGAIYSIPGGDRIGNSYIDTLQNLTSPEYNEVKVSLLAKLQALK